MCTETGAGDVAEATEVSELQSRLVDVTEPSLTEDRGLDELRAGLLLLLLMLSSHERLDDDEAKVIELPSNLLIIMRTRDGGRGAGADSGLVALLLDRL